MNIMRNPTKCLLLVLEWVERKTRLSEDALIIIFCISMLLIALT